MLGSQHPLARVMRAEEIVGRHALAVVLMLVAALGGWATGLAWALAAAIGATAALLVLGVVAAALRGRARWEALELIAEGREGLPLAPVERERRRLLGARNRAALAGSAERMLDAASRRPDTRAARPLFDVTVIRRLADDLRPVAEALRSGPASARGLALAEHLLTRGGSSLYGHDVAPAREDLRRVRYLLAQRPVVLTKS
jgi:hypothetical protein